MQYEVISYQYGSGIFNIVGKVGRFRHGIGEKTKFIVNQDKIYENKLPKNKLIYIYQNVVTEEPVIDIYFVSYESLKRFLKDNPLIKKRVGNDYFLNNAIYSYNDIRAT